MLVRVAGPRPAGGLRQASILAVLVAVCGTVGCTRPPDASAIRASWDIDPAAPALAVPARAILRLSDPDGRPLTGASLQVEAHMTHPGMAPVVAPAAERAPGVYEAAVAFTMAGPWTLVATGTLDDGRRVMETYELAVGD